MKVNIKWDVTEEEMTREEKKEVLENLPEEVDIPDGMWDEDEIADWLSEEFGFCYYGFELVD